MLVHQSNDNLFLIQKKKLIKLKKNGSNSLSLKQDLAKDGQNENNKDTGYSSSSSSNSGQQPSANCTNCNVLCNELKGTNAGSFCFSCHNHWRYGLVFKISLEKRLLFICWWSVFRERLC